MYTCNCGKSFTRSDNLHRHQLQSCRAVTGTSEPPSKRSRVSPSSQNDSQFCECCNKPIPVGQMVSHRRTLEHRSNSCIQLGEDVQIVESAFKCRIVSYRIGSGSNYVDYKTFFDTYKQKMVLLLEGVLKIHSAVRVNMELFSSHILQTQELSEVKCFNSPNQIVDQSMDLNGVLDSFIDTITAQSTEFENRDSGWSLKKIMFTEINVNKYSPLGACSYIKLPYDIESKKGVVNVRNEDNYCFAWAVVSALYPADRRVSEVSSYPPFQSVLNISGMDFPMKLSGISKFEVANDCSINVYGLEKNFKESKMKYEVVGPLHYSRQRLNRHVNILLISDETGKNHYCWIKDLSKLVSSQISANGHKKYFCDGCLLYFANGKSLTQHQLNDCNHVCTTTPSEKLKIDKFGKYIPENILKYVNIEKQMKVPFVVYADFESILKPIDSCQPNPDCSYTNRTHIHEPFSFAYYIKCSFDKKFDKFVSYRGVDTAKVFVSNIQNDLKNIYHKHLKSVVPMDQLSEVEEKEFSDAKTCGICDNIFEDCDIKVRDHCHLTGKKRFGAAHSKCNLNFKLPNFIPIICHNMSGYDCHLFIKELFDKGDRVDVIPQTKEKYISFTKHLFTHSYFGKDGKLKNNFMKLRFIDSYRFLSESLQNLGANLMEDQFIETKKFFPDVEKFQLMKQKGVFPYCFVDCMEKLDTTHLPSKEEFYDNLNDEQISDECYNRAERVWNLFGCRSLGEYSDLYLKSDVLLLTDTFENFREICLNTYKLDPAQYYTAPGLSWDAMLRYTKVELELLTDIDMIHFFKKGIRGGISQCSDRMHVANNEYLPNYDAKKDVSYISYLDATNLYGHSMSQPLPISGFTWLTPCEIQDLDVMSISADSPYGYVFEVDIHYPEELHDSHSDLPFLVESIIPPGSKSNIRKLIPNLLDKKNYIVHYRTLKQAIENGLMVVKTHRVLKFRQSPWLKKYIDLNTEMRNKALNKFEKQFFKLMNNAVYGKTLENVENRREIKLVTHWENIKRSLGANCLISNPNFKTCSIFTENFVAIHMGKVRVCYDKPLYLGFSILDLSKTVMYDFYYKCIKSNFGNDASLLYTDTDSFIMKITNKNFYEFMIENIERFDTSNYNIENDFGIPVTKPILGNMKDEFPNDPIISFYGTGAKAYFVQSVKNELKKAKGVKKSVIVKQLHKSDYKNIVEKGGCILRKMNSFKSDTHDIFTEMKNKVALSHHDDKRFIIPNTTKTLPWGHNDIEFYRTDPEQNLLWCSNIVESAMNNYSQSDINLDLLISLLEAE